MSIEMTWLDFQISTEYQNGRHYFYFFFRFHSKPGIYRFSGSASLLALSFVVCDWKRGYGGHLDFSIE